MNSSQNADATTGPQAETYSYRASLLGAPFTFRLTDAGLAFEAGRRAGLIPYQAIARVRLSFKPSSMQSRRYQAEIWAADAPKLTIYSSSWKSMMIQERQDQAYSAFLAALHRRLAVAGSAAQFERGSVPFLYWLGFAAFTAVTLGLALLIVRALQVNAKGGAIFIAAFLALFLWQGGNFLRRNKPGTYRPDAPPADLLP
ncbi:hypothetical protein [Undibacter mobilis]|uniref:Uncharacterized protein n=1 Tax=Undibacter mobilis TaxID=2292256 RepID=A0A371BC82_9BRAD|nr:hypothetical protein [Undibacter mobilis]RDV05170.1 hypothetical protein DXH78_11700 [Undibacter mobilis]